MDCLEIIPKCAAGLRKLTVARLWLIVFSDSLLSKDMLLLLSVAIHTLKPYTIKTRSASTQILVTCCKSSWNSGTSTNIGFPNRCSTGLCDRS